MEVRSMHEFTDELMGHVEWGKDRQVLVFLRTYADRQFVRMRIFNRHRKHGFFYPAPRSFQVGRDCARELGLAIARAAEGRKSTAPPEFTEQYEREGKLRSGKWKRSAIRRVTIPPRAELQ
jgi:hypothetical protein